MSEMTTLVDKATAKKSRGGTARVLIADDDPMAIKVLQKHLGSRFEVVVATDGEQAIAAMSDDLDVALLDLHMPEVSGFECIAHSQKHFPETQVIVITASGDVNDAVEAMKLGASEYISKPFHPEELVLQVQQAVKASQEARDHRGLKAVVARSLPTSEFATKSSAMKQMAKKIGKVAKLDSTVLITGESGTGKSTVARMIHQQGLRPGGPFVAVNCASLPRDLIEAELFGHAKGAFTGAVGDRPGRVEIANGGTLFLDEIGDLPLELQPKLLTFLQDRIIQRIGSNNEIAVDVRLIAATHQNLAEMCTQKRFRQDLFYRVNVLSLEIPAVKDRHADIPDLACSILERISDRRGTPTPKLDDSAIEKLQQYSWPGNIREMENVLESATAFCEGDSIAADDLSLAGEVANANVAEASMGPQLAGMSLAEVEKLAIQRTLDFCEWNKAKTARVLGISEKTIYNKMRRHGISK